MAASKGGTKTVNRSSITGRFVKESTVKRHPDKTEKETRPTGKRK